MILELSSLACLLDVVVFSIGPSVPYCRLSSPISLHYLCFIFSSTSPLLLLPFPPYSFFFFFLSLTPHFYFINQSLCSLFSHYHHHYFIQLIKNHVGYGSRLRRLYHHLHFRQPPPPPLSSLGPRTTTTAAACTQQVLSLNNLLIFSFSFNFQQP